MGKIRSKKNRIAAKARASLEGKGELSPQDLRHQITLSQFMHETPEKSCEQSLYSKASKSSHPVPKGSQSEEFGESSGCPSEDARNILKLRKDMEELKKQVDKDGSFGPTVEVISPFTARVMKAKLPRGVKAPKIHYTGITDPNDHLAAYQTHMLMHSMKDEIQCRLFVGTLEGPTIKWFLTLPNGTIDCFKDLAQFFLNAYGGRDGTKGSEKKNEKAEASTISIPMLKPLVPGEAAQVAEIKECSVNVLYWEAAQHLGVKKEDLTKLNMPLSRFTRDIIEPEGSIKLDVIIGAVLRDPSSSGRVIKWAMVLSQYDILYQPRSSKKGQVIADFMVECTARGKLEGKEASKEKEIWEMHSDGSCTKDGSRGGTVLTSPDGFKAYHAFMFMFRATNNEVEYEALIGGIKVALFMKIKNIHIKSDSKMVIGQLNGEMEAKEGRLKKYKDCARTFLDKFEYYELIYVPGEENTEADMLAKLCRTIPVHMESMVRQHEKMYPVWEEAVHVLEISDPGTTWMSPLFIYLEKGELPVDP
ncbi:unnamed protein product [Cuscuta campestris]|uniref:RNase H type-1 domain-containing protein n=1 Tax=Cuscuta campestris TaxID=132261 RepID=A0A484K9F4_9ASTE|nr:unnamed protein product [Cuscuta campestris]